MPATEGYVQVAPDSSGKRIRNVTITTLQADGTLQTTYQQVTAICDATTGLPIDMAQDEWRNEVVMLLRAIRRGIEVLCDEDIRDEQLEQE